MDLKKTEKNINNSLLMKIIEFRNKMLFHSDRNNYLGRLVFDLKNKEYGFILGPFNSINSNKKNEKRLLLVTLGEEDFRVRYTKQHYVKIIEDDINISLETSMHNIHYFCKEQCIFECSNQCIFYKYKIKQNDQ